MGRALKEARCKSGALKLKSKLNCTSSGKNQGSKGFGGVFAKIVKSSRNKK